MLQLAISKMPDTHARSKVYTSRMLDLFLPSAKYRTKYSKTRIDLYIQYAKARAINI